MDTAVKPVQTGRRRRWSAEQKLIVLQEWHTGIPLEELCRTYAMHAAQMSRWKRSLDQGCSARRFSCQFESESSAGSATSVWTGVRVLG